MSEQSARPRILCISLSGIVSDARVLRQIGVLAEFGDVTTVGFGPRPDGATEHIEVPGDLKTLPQTPLGVARLALRRWRAVEVAAPAIAWTIDALADRRFDLVVANEARVLALANRVAHGAPIWADMHEWAPEERTHILSWRLLVAPFMTYLCRTYLPAAGAVTTVAPSIADLYAERFGVLPVLMRNSGPWRDLPVHTTDPDRVRLVHSGVAVHGRRLELMIDAIARLDERFSLDLYLLPSADGGAYLRELRERAAGSSRIVFHEGVAPAELPIVLNDYDVGVFWIPPTHTNARLTLPNKLFDYIQARLAIAVGPSVEMARLVHEHRLGVVSEGFELDQCVSSIATLTAEQIDRYKRASAAAARELSFETDAAAARTLLRDLLRIAH